MEFIIKEGVVGLYYATV